MLTTIDYDKPLTSEPVRNRGPVAISIRNLCKRFRVRRRFLETLRHPFRQQYMRALDNVNCDIHSGEFFGFLGSNGAGKTTLFKILATLVSPDEGTVIVDGFDVTKNAAGVRQVLTPVIADERSLRWRLSARENLRLYAVLYGLPAKDVASRVDEVLKVVGLDPTDAKLAGRFSSGMRQRLLIARALIPRPRVLLLDEPTRSLDPVSARNLRAFLRDEVCRRLGCTILLATHTAEEAFELCDRVAILDHGHPVAIGEAAKLQLQFGENRYKLWTRTPDHPTIEALARKDLIRDVSIQGVDEAGWATVDMSIPGGDVSAGLEPAAHVLQCLVKAGLVVSRFERIDLSLGDLIQRVIERSGGGRRA
jgi:ABC-type multidrug transport system ATPase subunit